MVKQTKSEKKNDCTQYNVEKFELQHVHFIILYTSTSLHVEGK